MAIVLPGEPLGLQDQCCGWSGPSTQSLCRDGAQWVRRWRGCPCDPPGPRHQHCLPAGPEELRPSRSASSRPGEGPQCRRGPGGCLVEYMAKVHALDRVSQELEAQLRRHLESKAASSEGWGALRASWASSCQQVGEAVLENARLMLRTEAIQAGAEDFKER
ncbi:Phakinin [Manis pentadactyla]|nr:Phakinin [Manis pentadactyla]